MVSEIDVPEISRDEIRRRLNDPSLVLVDVLPRDSYDGEHLPRANSLPLAEVAERAKEVLPDRTADIALYCAGAT
jgi:rhodanese-related sulfurtransferase